MDARKPTVDDVGDNGKWHLEDAGGLLELDGDLLSVVSTHQPAHEGHFERWAKRGKAKCRACRWFEIMIFATSDGRYVMHRIGRSEVPGEELPMYTPITIVATATALVDEAHHIDKRTGVKSLSFIAREALEGAAEYDDGIDEALRALSSIPKNQPIRRI